MAALTNDEKKYINRRIGKLREDDQKLIGRKIQRYKQVAGNKVKYTKKKSKLLFVLKNLPNDLSREIYNLVKDCSTDKPSKIVLNIPNKRIAQTADDIRAEREESNRKRKANKIENKYSKMLSMFEEDQCIKRSEDLTRRNKLYTIYIAKSKKNEEKRMKEFKRALLIKQLSEFDDPLIGQLDDLDEIILSENEDEDDDMDRGNDSDMESIIGEDDIGEDDIGDYGVDEEDIVGLDAVEVSDDEESEDSIANDSE